MTDGRDESDASEDNEPQVGEEPRPIPTGRVESEERGESPWVSETKEPT